MRDEGADYQGGPKIVVVMRRAKRLFLFCLFIVFVYRRRVGVCLATT